MFRFDLRLSQFAGQLMVRKCCVLFTSLLISISAASQTPSPTPIPAEDTPALAKSNSEFKRWIDIDALAVSTRYRFIENNAGVTTNNQMQWQFNGRGRFKFDRASKYSVYSVVGTGVTLTSGWNNAGWGTGDGQTDLYVKQLYADAKPVITIGVQV